MNLDDELRSAFRREDPPEGFARRVAARAQSPEQKIVPIRKPRMLWAAGLAAMLAVGFGVQLEYRQVQEERAARDAVIALRIAADKLTMTRNKLLKLEN
jgi:hypothetical protein